MVADEQKRRFAKNPTNKGKWIDEGLWSISRHPNYLGEITLWVGAYIVSFSSLEGGERSIGITDWVISGEGLMKILSWCAAGWDWLSLLGPVFVITLLSQISLPMTEAGADKRWKEENGYKEYKARVAPLIPYWH